MGERCKICIDPKCKGKETCDCTSCVKREECHRVLRPTIRITRKCTQSCAHCCFECSPKETDHMSLQESSRISEFLAGHDIKYANIMGGEVWCHPQWQEILETLIEPLQQVRIVTNGDWVVQSDKEQIIQFLKDNPKIKLSISVDPFHTNKHVQEAQDLCEQQGIRYKIQEDFDAKCLIPTGRLTFDSGTFYSTFGTYCRNPEKMYSFLIDETGGIYKCGFGAWKYTEVKNHLGTEVGSFFEEFRDLGRRFNGVFVSNCGMCLRSWNRNKREQEAEELIK